MHLRVGKLQKRYMKDSVMKSGIWIRENVYEKSVAKKMCARIHKWMKCVREIQLCLVTGRLAVPKQ